MICFPNSKINLGLYVTGKRDDGFHRIESIFYPVPFLDVLEIIPSAKFSFETEGISVTENPEDNLAVKAYWLMQKEFDLPPVNMFLLKNIPSGAGLGGGSSDASSCLKLLNDVFKLNLSLGQLTEYALQLGSDCPFFIANYPCYVFGRGEMMEAVNLNLTGIYVVIICSGIHINTGEAFRSLTSFSTLKVPVPHLIHRDRPFWKESLQNNFEPYAFEKFPVLKEIKEELYKEGAFYASMSGTGSSIFGLFEKKPGKDLDVYKNQEGYVVWEGELGK